MKKLELELRHKLRDAMGKSWLLTWHEDGHVSPGVPDLSFVMRGGDCETGWMELKAEKVYNKQAISFQIEPSQIEWIKRHRGLIPIFFLVAVGEEWFLLDGSWAERLHDVGREDLYSGSIARGILGTLSSIAPHLIARTTRK